MLGQSDVFGVKSKGFSKIRQIRLFRQEILENLDCLQVVVVALTCIPENQEFHQV